VKRRKKRVNVVHADAITGAPIEKIVHAAEEALHEAHVLEGKPGNEFESRLLPAHSPLRAKVLNTGLNITMGDRNQSYGDPLENFEAIASLKRSFWHSIHYGNNDPLITQNSAVGHAIDMVLNNIGRIASAPSLKAIMEIDRCVDGATYLAIFHELLVRTVGKDHHKSDV
jgi:hypothetical protein